MRTPVAVVGPVVLQVHSNHREMIKSFQLFGSMEGASPPEQRFCFEPFTSPNHRYTGRQHKKVFKMDFSRQVSTSLMHMEALFPSPHQGHRSSDPAAAALELRNL